MLPVILVVFVACKPSGPKKLFELKQEGTGVVFDHRDFTVTIPERDVRGVIPVAMDDSSSFSISTIKNIYPFYHVFFRPTDIGESRWDDDMAQQQMHMMEEKGNYEAKYREVNIQGVEAYEVAYLNYLLDTTAGQHKPVIQYTRELTFTHDSIAYWLEITTEDTELTDEQSAEFFGSFKFK